jgi:hypothetical protein
MSDLGFRLVRARYPILAVWAAAWAVPIRSANATSTDYGYFLAGGRILTGGSLGSYHDGVLHFFAYAPGFQIGPPPLFLDGALERWLPAIAEPLWWTLIMVCGLVAVRSIELTARGLGQSRLRAAQGSAVAGLVLLPCWASVEHYVHLDDALAVAAILVATACVARQRAWWMTGAALGMAAACKPWAAIALPLVLALPARKRVAGAAVAVAVIAAWWGPFIIGDPQTVSALESVQTVVTERSVMSGLGYSRFFAPEHTHLLEMLLGGSLSALAVVRGRWLMAPLAAFAARILLEPKYLLYYGIGPVAAALLCDVVAGRRVPAWGLATVAVEYGAQLWLPPRAGALAQLALGLAIIASLFGNVSRARSNSSAPTEPKRSWAGLSGTASGVS